MVRWHAGCCGCVKGAAKAWRGLRRCGNSVEVRVCCGVVTLGGGEECFIGALGSLGPPLVGGMTGNKYKRWR